MNVLAIGCHPDDLEIGCYGTLAKYVKEGHKVFVCHVANGSLGHVVIEPDELRRVRDKEARAAAALIGAEPIIINSVDDLTVDSSKDSIRRELVNAIRYAKPDVIITHNPDDYMRDHEETSKLAYDASFACSVVHYETEESGFYNIVPLYYMDTLAGVNFLPTEYVDITETIDLKIEALDCHQSQIKWMREHDNIDFLDFYKTCSKFRGLQCGAGFAEGFRPAMCWPRMVPKRLLP